MEKRCMGCMALKRQSPVCEHCGFAEGTQNAPHQLPAGTLLRGQYRVGRALGQGGFGITYLGFDENLEIPIAIKEYYPSGMVARNTDYSNAITVNNNDSVYQGSLDRFIREARSLAKLDQVPGIVGVKNFFTENGTAYIIMEYLMGQDLRDYLAGRKAPLPPAETLALLRPVMKSLDRAHKAGVIHRDISPDNIMLLKSGGTKLLDFGTARDMAAGIHSTELILKHGFAPSEQYLTRGDVGPWTDVYALCATAYYCMTGKVPPSAPDRSMGGERVDFASIPGIAPSQAKVLNKGMAIRPEERFPSVGAMIDALDQAVPQPPVKKDIPRPEKPKTEKKPQPPRIRWLAIAVAAAALVLAAVLLPRLPAEKDTPAEPQLSGQDTPVSPPEVPTATETEEPPTGPAPTSEFFVMTHEEYMAAAMDAEVIVETYVQATQSWWNNWISAYCQSPDGAYFLYDMACSEEDAAKLVPGTKIRVTGTKGAWAGLIEITEVTFEFVEGDTFIAKPFDATALLGTDELIDHQNEFVTFTGMTVEGIEYKNGKPGDDIYVTLGYNGASYSFCVERYLTGPESEVYTTVGSLNVVDVVNLQGFLYWYDGPLTHITSISVA